MRIKKTEAEKYEHIRDLADDVIYDLEGLKTAIARGEPISAGELERTTLSCLGDLERILEISIEGTKIHDDSMLALRKGKELLRSWDITPEHIGDIIEIVDDVSVHADNRAREIRRGRDYEYL